MAGARLTFGGVGGSREGGEGADVGERSLAGFIGRADAEVEVRSLRQFADFVCVGVTGVHADKITASTKIKERQ